MYRNEYNFRKAIYIGRKEGRKDEKGKGEGGREEGKTKGREERFEMKLDLTSTQQGNGDRKHVVS